MPELPKGQLSMDERIEQEPNLLNEQLRLNEGMAQRCNDLQRELAEKPDPAKQASLDRYTRIFKNRIGFPPADYAEVRQRVDEKLGIKRKESQS